MGHPMRLDGNVVVGEFELQLSYYVHFPINTFREGMTPPTTNDVLNSTPTALL